MTLKIYNPKQLDRPLGQYSHVARVKASEFLFISGQLANDQKGEVVGRGDFEAQVTQSFANMHTVLTDAGLDWGNLVQCTTYVTDARFIPRLHQWRLANFPSFFKEGIWPTNTLLVVSGLVREEFLFELHAIAAFE